MRGLALVMACSLAACGSSGVDIDIFMPDDIQVDRVELWTTYEDCEETACDGGIAWASGSRLTGDVNLVSDEAVIRAVEREDRWVLHLEAASGYDGPKAIAIAGFSGSTVKAVKVLRYPQIPTHSNAVWQVFMHPAEVATTDLPMPADPSVPTYRAHVWQREPTADVPEPAGCLTYQKWDDSTQQWNVEYFVPKSDPDCDGQPDELECNPYWYDFKASDAGGCVGVQPLGAVDACQLGSFGCTDGVGGDRSCGPSAVSLATCMPDQFCSCTTAIPADGCIAGAVTDGIASDMPYFACSIPMIAGTECDKRINISLPRPSMTECKAVLLHYLDKPFTEPQGTLLFSTPLGPVKLTAILQPLGECVVDVQWVEGAREALDGLRFLLEIEYLNANRALYPVDLHLDPVSVTCASGSMLSIGCAQQGTLDGVVACGNVT